MNSVVYLSNSRIPSTMANSVQIMKMCEAMSLTGSKVTLVKPKRYNEFQNDKFNLFNFYDIKHRFKIQDLPYLDIHKFEKLSPNYLYRLFNYINSMFWENYLMNYYLKYHKGNMIFMRNTLHFAIDKITKHQIPSIIEFHSLPSERYLHRYKKMFASNKNIYPLALTKGLAEDLSDNLKIHLSDILVLPGAVDSSKYKFKYNFDHSNKNLTITYVGSLIENRGVTVLLESAKNLPNILIQIIGGVAKELDNANKYISSQNIQNVKLLGHKSQHEIYKYYNESDILVLPMSGKEIHTQKYASPNKLFEYMASGKAIIASNLDSINEVLTDGKDCVLFDPDNSDDLTNKIKLLVENSHLRFKLGENAKKLSENFSWEKRVLKIYNHVGNSF